MQQHLSVWITEAKTKMENSFTSRESYRVISVAVFVFNPCKNILDIGNIHTFIGATYNGYTELGFGFVCLCGNEWSGNSPTSIYTGSIRYVYFYFEKLKKARKSSPSVKLYEKIDSSKLMFRTIRSIQFAFGISLKVVKFSTLTVPIFLKSFHVSSQRHQMNRWCQLVIHSVWNVAHGVIRLQT